MRAHYLHFLILLGILAGGAWAFFYVRTDRYLQLLVGVATAAAYVLWGIIHHVIQRDLHIKIVVEYILIGAIAAVLLFTLAL